MAVVSLTAFLGLPAAQTPPPESTSKVKRVLMCRNNFWAGADNAVLRADKVFANLVAAKGFVLDTLQPPYSVTLEFLRQYQVVVWNNKDGGIHAFPDSGSRSALVEYLRQGGGWMLLYLTADHNGAWPEFQSLLGTRFSSFYKTASHADILKDSASLRHKELRFLAAGLPDSLRLRDYWLRFSHNVRPLPDVTVLYNAANGKALLDQTYFIGSDGNGLYPHTWARDVQEGRLFYSGLGFLDFEATGVDSAPQADSAVARLIWQGLRWLAGDFRNGCTHPNMPGFDPEARVDDGSCTGLKAVPGPAGGLGLSAAGRIIRLGTPASGDERLVLRDLRGARVRGFALPSGAREWVLDEGLPPGVYLLEAFNGDGMRRYRLAIPR